jgi:hypothetical protein
MRIRFIPFSKLPQSDTCWALIEGPDECVYAAACSEMVPGGTVFIVRYNPRTEELEYLLDVARVVGEPPENQRATQCKIHYSMLINDDGVMYGATHLSGPAVTEVKYNPWGSFNDPERSYVGARMFAYDCASEDVLWTETLIPWEGCRCLAFSHDRNSLYAVGYPRDHFYRFNLRERERQDLGRLGSVNPQTIWLDGSGTAYTTDDYGYLVACPPDEDQLIDTAIKLPHAPYQNGWHNVVYDVVAVPGSEDCVGVAWNLDPYLFRFTPGERPGEGKVLDLGPASPGIEGRVLRGVNTDHAGGLVFNAAGDLMLSVTTPQSESFSDRLSILKCMEIDTGEMEEVCPLVDEDGVHIKYISRAVRVGARHLIMGVVGTVPTGILHVTLDEDLAHGPFESTPRRYWG